MSTTDLPAIRAGFTTGLRALADWIDQHPELDIPMEVEHGWAGGRYTIGVLGYDPVSKRIREDIPGDFAAAVRALGGHRHKQADEDTMRVCRDFGPGVSLEIWTGRDDICEGVVVGTETVEVERIIQPAVVEKVTEERDVIEWRCAPLITGAIGLGESREALQQAAG